MRRTARMPGLHLDSLELPRRARHRFESKLWRTWWFLRVMFRHFRARLLVLALMLAGGGLAFRWLEPERGHSFVEAMFYTWSLVFGETPEAFPEPILLQIMFFVLPVLGMVMVLEGIVECIRPGDDKRLFPPPQTRLEAGDRLMVQGPFDVLRKIPELADQRGGRRPEPVGSAAHHDR